MSEIIPRYPEQDIWKFDPPLHNLTPDPPDETSDTKAFLERARRETRLSSVNPLHDSYGPNPFRLKDLVVYSRDIPMSEYREPLPLNQAKLATKLVFLEEINPGGNTPVLKVRVGDTIRLLKIVCVFSV